MATRKQRRRRDKERRHEYEYVFVDEQGRELDPEAVEVEPKPTRERKAAKPAARGNRRQPQPPSWQRVFKRTGIFAPLMFGIILLLQRSGDRSIPAAFLQTLILMAIFVPFSYLMDMLLWRQHRKRSAGGAASAGTKPKQPARRK